MLTLAQFFVYECIKHIFFRPGHVVHQKIGGIVGQQMDNLDRLILGLTMGSTSDLALVLSRPWLVLEGVASDVRGWKDGDRALAKNITMSAIARLRPADPTLEKISTRAGCRSS
jgi:hypothetical protein